MGTGTSHANGGGTKTGRSEPTKSGGAISTGGFLNAMGSGDKTSVAQTLDAVSPGTSVTFGNGGAMSANEISYTKRADGKWRIWRIAEGGTITAEFNKSASSTASEIAEGIKSGKYDIRRFNLVND